MTKQQSGGLVGDMHWSDFARHREQIKPPTRTRLLSKPLAAQIIIKEKGPTSRVLDIGAGENKVLGVALQRTHSFVGLYKTLDVDPRVAADFRDIDEVAAEYDVVTMLEVIEHLEIDKAIELLQKIRGKLTNNGLLILSTPDPSHPTWIREDISHVQHYPYKDLTAILVALGYQKVEVYRIVPLPKLTKYPPIVSELVSYIGIVFRRILSSLLDTNFESKTLVFAAHSTN